MNSLSIVRVVIARSCQLRADSQLDLGLGFECALLGRRTGASRTAPGGACARQAPSGVAVPAYFSQPANAGLVQPSPEWGGAGPSGLPP
jgi:hypothetical protein